MREKSFPAFEAGHAVWMLPGFTLKLWHKAWAVHAFTLTRGHLVAVSAIAVQTLVYIFGVRRARCSRTWQRGSSSARSVLRNSRVMFGKGYGAITPDRCPVPGERLFMAGIGVA